MSNNPGKTKPWMYSRHTWVASYIVSDATAIESKSNLDALKNSSCESYDITVTTKHKSIRKVSGTDEEDFKRHRFGFRPWTYLRGPAVCIKKMLYQYYDALEIGSIEDFGNGIAQVNVELPFWDASIFRIMEQYPILRITSFAFISGSQYVIYSESGYNKFTHEHYLDSAKDEGEHWIHEADVLKSGNYSVFDTRTGSSWRENYRFPFRTEWEKDQFYIEEAKQYYTVCPKKGKKKAHKRYPEDSAVINSDTLLQLKAEYAALRQKYLEILQGLTYTTDAIAFPDKVYFGYSLPATDISAMGGKIKSHTDADRVADYWVMDPEIDDAETIPAQEIEVHLFYLNHHVEQLHHFLANASKQGTCFVKRQDVQWAITMVKHRAMSAKYDALKAMFPFDHLSTIACQDKKFAFTGLNDWNLRDKVNQLGGVIMQDVTQKCDYLIAGLNTASNSKAVAAAIRFRDSGKSPIMLLSEDEVIRMLNGEVLEIPEDYLPLLQARHEAQRKIEEEKLQALARKQQAAEEAAQRSIERKKEREEDRAREAAWLEEIKKRRLEEKHHAFLQRQEAERIAKEEQAKQREAERASMILESVILYQPGQEPADIRKRIDRLFEKLDQAYPDKKVISLTADHKKWAEAAGELRRQLGYADTKAFLEAYGYSVIVENKGGRPATNNYDAVIEELKRRYPNGGCKNVTELKAANGDLPIKTLVNNAQKLFGMPLKDYLKQIGVL